MDKSNCISDGGRVAINQRSDLDILDAANVLGVYPADVARLILWGKLTATKGANGRDVISADELQKYKQSLTLPGGKT